MIYCVVILLFNKLTKIYLNKIYFVCNVIIITICFYGGNRMIRLIKDSKYDFSTVFNMSTGEYLRGFDTPIEPFMAEYPHLIDVGVMGHCKHGKSGMCMAAGIKCYQNGLKENRPNMTLENYKKIIDESADITLEIALGGRGDPDMHENFEEILKYTREHNIVPNFTTSGFGMTKKKAEICKKYCGAVAVSMYSRLTDIVPDIAIRRLNEGETKIYQSENDIPVKFTLGNINSDCFWEGPTYKINGVDYEWDEVHHMRYSENPQKYECFRVYTERSEILNYDNYTMKAIQMLLDAGVKTNIHFVLSNTTIDEALIRLKYNGFPQGINAVVFLLHKPIGLGTESDVLEYSDSRVKEFFELVDKGNLSYKVGFDSCSIPGVLHFCHNIDKNSLDTCEGSRFSMYIDSEMIALPCSFDNQDKKYGVQLSEDVKIIDAWNSKEFNLFRKSLRNSCRDCSKREFCMGGCPLVKSVVLCEDKEKDFYKG